MPMNLPGVFAISATFLQGTYNQQPLANLVAFLNDRSPRQVLGGTIYIYDWDPEQYDAFVHSHKH